MMYRMELIEPSFVKKCFNTFYGSESDLYFEIMKENVDVGLYRIKKVTNKICEISLYVYNDYRKLITKGLPDICFNFPFSFGYEKVIISTELKKMVRFLKKMSIFGVKYITEHDEIYWFEVNK
jgi:hypothetical protein